jgi:hypothetical protein
MTGDQTGDARRDRVVLFLDIDGALSALSARHGFKDGRRRMVDGYQLNVSRQLGERIRRLDVEVRWLTTWGEQANEVGKLIGLPPYAVAALPPSGASSAGSWKLDAVRSHIAREPRPFIWVDDEAIDEHAEAWAADCGTRSLLVRPKPNRGLEPADLDQMERFIDGEAPQGAEPPDSSHRRWIWASGRKLTAVELRIYRRAGLDEEAAATWANAGIEPYQAEGYCSRGLDLDEALRWLRAGVSGNTASQLSSSELRQVVDRNEQLLDDLERHWSSAASKMTLSDRAHLADQLGAGLAVEQVARWLDSGGPWTDISQWLASGLSPSEAARLHQCGVAPPTEDHLNQFAASGIPTSEALGWLAAGFTVEKALPFHELGIAPSEATEWVDAGISAEDAAALQRRGSAGPDTTPVLDVDPSLGWTEAELAQLAPDTLAWVLRIDFRSDPTDTTDPETLRSRILEQQAKGEHVGTLRWIEWGATEILLYEPEQVAPQIEAVRIVESLETWGQVRALPERAPVAAQLLYPFIWDAWNAGNFGLLGLHDDELIEQLEGASTLEQLVQALPADQPVAFNNLVDGEPTILDPFDAMQVGVPVLIQQRYGKEHSNMVSTWRSFPREQLQMIEQTLAAIGWSIEPGSTDELGV